MGVAPKFYCCRIYSQGAAVLEGLKTAKILFILHTETTKVRHEWQETVVNACIQNFKALAHADLNNFRALVASYWDYFHYSVSKLSANAMPSADIVFEEVCRALDLGYVQVVKVNSDSDTLSLMDDESGQLKLSSPLMVFVGGSILDRGISIENLISFYYGRSPRRFQIDSVLQHLRRFGPRPMEDMAVTRT